MASEKLPPVVFDDDNPEWTEEDFARARPAIEVLPPEVLAAFGKKRGRPAGTTTSDRQQVTLRLPRDVIDFFKADGPGWQTRAVEVLTRAAKEGNSSYQSAKTGRYTTTGKRPAGDKKRA